MTGLACMSEFLANEKYWRDRAKATRAIAERYRTSEAQKKKLLKVVDEYERLADRAAQWQSASEVERTK